MLGSSSTTRMRTVRRPAPFDSVTRCSIVGIRWYSATSVQFISGSLRQRRRGTALSGSPPSWGEGWGSKGDRRGGSPSSGLLRVCGALAERDVERLRAAIAIDRDRHFVARGVLEEEVEQRVLLVDLLAVELRDHVTLLDSGVR